MLRPVPMPPPVPMTPPDAGKSEDGHSPAHDLRPSMLRPVPMPLPSADDIAHADAAAGTDDTAGCRKVRRWPLSRP